MPKIKRPATRAKSVKSASRSKIVKKTKSAASSKVAKGATRARVATSPTVACTFPTAIGTMALAWREEKIIGVFLPEATEAKLLTLVRKRTKSPLLQFSPGLPSFVGHIAAQIRAQLRGEPQTFGFEHFEIPGKAEFTRKVYECSQTIPSGEVLTYRELAEKAGSPKAFRAVGQAMAKNPFPIVIPCHRVVGTTKSAGGFSAHGGLATKARILEIENHEQK